MMNVSHNLRGLNFKYFRLSPERQAALEMFVANVFLWHYQWSTKMKKTQQTFVEH